MLKDTIDKLMLWAVVIIFSSVIIYAAIVQQSFIIGLTLLPFMLFLVIIFVVNKKRADNKNE